MRDNNLFWYVISFGLFVLGCLKMLDGNIITGFIMLIISFILGIGAYIAETELYTKPTIEFDEAAFDENVDFTFYPSKPYAKNNAVNTMQNIDNDTSITYFTPKKGAIIKKAETSNIPINYDVLDLNKEPKKVEIPKTKHILYETKPSNKMAKNGKTSTLILYENSNNIEIWIKEAYEAIIKAIKSINNDDEVVSQFLSSIEYVDNYNDVINILYNTDAIFTFFDKVELSELIRNNLKDVEPEKVIVNFEKFEYKKIYDYYLENKTI